MSGARVRPGLVRYRVQITQELQRSKQPRLPRKWLPEKLVSSSRFGIKGSMVVVGVLKYLLTRSHSSRG